MTASMAKGFISVTRMQAGAAAAVKVSLFKAVNLRRPGSFAFKEMSSSGQKKDPAFGKRDQCAVGFGYFLIMYQNLGLFILGGICNYPRKYAGIVLQKQSSRSI